MKKMITVAVLTLFCGSMVHAADPSEAGVPASRLKIYSCGFGIGEVMALNQELSDESKQFMKLSIVNTFAFRDNLDLFLDVDWFVPNNNIGADLGLDCVFLKGDFRPFAGIGCGAHYIDKDGAFGDELGPSFTAHIGFIFDLTENVAIKMRLPYHLILNESRDHAAGLDFAFIFSSRYKKVKKLEYN